MRKNHFSSICTVSLWSLNVFPSSSLSKTHAKRCNLCCGLRCGLIYCRCRLAPSTLHQRLIVSGGMVPSSGCFKSTRPASFLTDNLPQLRALIEMIDSAISTVNLVLVGALPTRRDSNESRALTGSSSVASASRSVWFQCWMDRSLMPYRWNFASRALPSPRPSLARPASTARYSETAAFRTSGGTSLPFLDLRFSCGDSKVLAGSADRLRACAATAESDLFFVGVVCRGAGISKHTAPSTHGKLCAQFGHKCACLGCASRPKLLRAN